MLQLSKGFQPFGMLPAGPAPADVSQLSASALQLSAFPALFSHQLHAPALPAIALELAPAPHYCEECWLYVEPENTGSGRALNYGANVASSHPGWILFPCHERYCERCEYVETEWCHECDQCSDCCHCWFCSSCSEMVKRNVRSCSNCETCPSCCECYQCLSCNGAFSDSSAGTCGDHCQECCDCSSYDEDCDCSECRSNRGSDYRYREAGWQVRGWEAEDSGDCRELFRDWAQLDPAAAMASFYLCELVRFRAGTSTSYGRDAARIQASIVNQCDGMFRDYSFLAIGGEVRHHVNVRAGGTLPSSRETAWSYWYAMGERYGRSQLIADCVELFGCDSWGSSYGGPRWKTIAETLYQRENGTLDARTFVDRVFSLQHNGGSLLNKASWSIADSGSSTGAMVDIGNAHHAAETDCYALFQYSYSEARELFLAVPSSMLSAHENSDRARCVRWLENAQHYSYAQPVERSYCVRPRMSDELAQLAAHELFAAREELARSSSQLAYALELARELIGTGSLLARGSDESVWSWNARIHSYVSAYSDGAL